MTAIMRARLALVGATAFWAGNYVVGHFAVASLDPFSLTLLRWALAVVPLLLIAQIVERPQWRSVWRHWRFLTMQAGFGLIGYGLFVYAALGHTSAFAASLVNAANPALIAIAAWWVVAERLTVRGWAGIGIAFLGVLILLTGGDLGRLSALQFGLGEVFMLGAIVVWTGYTVAGRKGPALPPITAVAAQAAISVVALGAAAPFIGIRVPSGPLDWWALIFIAALPSCGSYVLWNLALRDVPSSRAGVYLNLITVFTAAAAVVSGTTITPAQLIGGATVLSGVLLTSGMAPPGVVPKQ